MDGLPARLPITLGQASDKSTVPALLHGLLLADALVADRGYDSMAIVDLMQNRDGEAHIPTQSGVRIQRPVQPARYRQLNLVERFFCKLKHFRRVATRFNKLERNFLAAVLLVATRLRLRPDESTT